MNTATRIWMTPTIAARRKVVSKASESVCGPTMATALKTTSEIAFVGPLIKWDDDPNTEAMAVTTMAEYSPNRGSIPAISA